MSETANKKNRSRVNTANVNKKPRKTKKKGTINQKELDEMVRISVKNKNSFYFILRFPF